MIVLPERWHPWLAGRRLPRQGVGEPPLRAELFSVEQLARHAKSLAASHQIATVARASPLLVRLAYNESVLRDFNHATTTGKSGRRLTPAAEWLLDNFYLIEEQIQLARRHLPRKYNRELPCLDNSIPAGLPRVYDIVTEFISHTDAQVDAESLYAFVDAYQAIHSLKLGELWAVPIMLRLGLIENLQRVTTRLVAARIDRDLADNWVDRLQEMVEKNPSHLVVVVADMAKSELPVTSAFVTQFTERLSRQSPVLHLARTWLEHHLLEQGLSIEQLVHQESQNKAADQISVSHSIGSLRFLGAMDWKDFVESLSHVEETLRSDPSGVYRTMDFATRDTYRHAVETMARFGKLTECQVALKAIQLAADNARQHGPDNRTAHVGYYLAGNGRHILAEAAQARWPVRTRLENGIQRFPLLFYIGGISCFPCWRFWASSMLAVALDARGWPLVMLTLVVLVCASQLAVGLMNWLSIVLVSPRALPRLDFSRGIASDCRTMVVVPTMLTSDEGVQSLLESLEIHYLANRDPLPVFRAVDGFPRRRQCGHAGG